MAGKSCPSLRASACVSARHARATAANAGRRQAARRCWRLRRPNRAAMATIGSPSHKISSARSWCGVRNANVRPSACRARARSCALGSLRYGFPIIPLLLGEPHTVFAQIVQSPYCQNKFKSLVWPHMAIPAVVPLSSTYAPVFLQSTIHDSCLRPWRALWSVGALHGCVPYRPLWLPDATRRVCKGKASQPPFGAVGGVLDRQRPGCCCLCSCCSISKH